MLPASRRLLLLLAGHIPHSIPENCFDFLWCLDYPFPLACFEDSFWSCIVFNVFKLACAQFVACSEREDVKLLNNW
jgi:hypothetical protein